MGQEDRTSNGAFGVTAVTRIPGEPRWNAAKPQTGGSGDLDVLWEELRRWPGYYVEGITPGRASSSRDREDQHKPDSGWFETFDPRSWCITVEQEGWEPRDHWLAWGASIAAAASSLAGEMRRMREEPHLMHIGLISEGYFQRGCVQCEREAHELFDDKVEFTA